MSTETTTPAKNSLPEDCFFAYVVSHEAWYASVVKGRQIWIQAASREGGVAWEFAVEEEDLGGQPHVRVEIFDDAFAAFAQIPEFFAALAERKPDDLLKVADLLDEVGAKDTTERTGPNGIRSMATVPRDVHDKLVSLGWAPPERAR